MDEVLRRELGQPEMYGLSKRPPIKDVRRKGEWLVKCRHLLTLGGYIKLRTSASRYFLLLFQHILQSINK